MNCGDWNFDTRSYLLKDNGQLTTDIARYVHLFSRDCSWLHGLPPTERTPTHATDLHSPKLFWVLECTIEVNY